MADICARREIQAAWGEWRAVTDREELRLRLDLLRRIGPLDSVLDDFLTFFFRASDPVLYQSAAKSLGAHVSGRSDLMDYLRTYAEQRSVFQEKPILLNDERSRRRLLIARAAHVASTESRQGTVPLRLEDPSSYLALSAADQNAALVATSVLLEGSRPSSKVKHFAYQLVEGIARHAPTTKTDPGFFHTWSQVLALLNQADARRTCSVWWTLLDRLLDPKTEERERGFAERILRLSQIDEVVRGAVFLEPELQRELCRRVQETCSGEERLYLLYRWETWTERELREEALDFKAVLQDHRDEGGEIVQRLVRADLRSPTEHPIGGTDSVEAQRMSLFGDMIQAMGRKSEWLARPVHQRALIGFAAMDLSRYISGPSSVLESLFTGYGFPPLRRDGAGSRPRTTAMGTAGPTSYRIMLRLSDWESFGATHFVGTRMVHQITDPYVLLMLLPSYRESERTAVLADAVEHQLRLQLTTTPDFQPERFLYETSVRAPHPQFYEHLKQRCQGRTYKQTEGTTVPVPALVDRLEKETQAIRSQPETRKTRETVTEVWPGDAPFSIGVRYVRRELFEIQEEPSLIEGLEQLVDLLDPKTTDPASGSKGLLGLVEGASRPSTPLIRRGRSREEGRTYRELGEGVLEQVIDLRKALDELQPATLDRAVAVRDDVMEVQDALELVEKEVVPVIGVVEGHLLHDVVESLRDRLQAWTDSLAEVHGVWQAGLEEEVDLLPLADELFERVLTYDTGPTRTALLQILATTLLNHARENSTPSFPDFPSDQDLWEREKNLLAWAVAPSQVDRLTASECTTWMQKFTESWVHLMQVAMDAGYETRVRRLVQEDRFSCLRSRSTTGEILVEAREWCLDRYHLPAAIRATQARTEGTGRMKAIGSTIAAFFTHFSGVWLALLVGAILMLDFGGAWTAMAAEGDVARVAVTFVVGVVGTFGYLFVDLRQKVRLAPEESIGAARLSRLLRLIAFLLVCLAITFVLTSLLWGLLAGTGEVVEGPGAVLHVVVWTGFALFVGVFFGLIAEAA